MPRHTIFILHKSILIKLNSFLKVRLKWVQIYFDKWQKADFKQNITLFAC